MSKLLERKRCSDKEQTSRSPQESADCHADLERRLKRHGVEPQLPRLHAWRRFPVFYVSTKGLLQTYLTMVPLGLGYIVVENVLEGTRILQISILFMLDTNGQEILS